MVILLWSSRVIGEFACTEGGLWELELPVGSASTQNSRPYIVL